MRRVKKVVVAVSALQPTRDCPSYTVRRFYSVPAAQAEATMERGKQTLVNLLGVELSAVTATTSKPKLSYRWHYKPLVGDAAKELNEWHAVEYVNWIAKRDGLTIPLCPVQKIIWSGIYSAHETHTHRRYDGTLVKSPRYLHRIQAVAWGHNEEIYNTRKNGQRGAYLYTSFVEEFRIEIPHWDFEPAPAIEETISDDSELIVNAPSLLPELDYSPAECMA